MQETLALVFPSCRMNSNEYTQVLEDHLLVFLQGNAQVRFRFRQDNTSLHVSRITAGWLHIHSIDLLWWRPCSPDMNPVENLWAIPVRHVDAERPGMVSKKTSLFAWLATSQAWLVTSQVV